TWVFWFTTFTFTYSTHEEESPGTFIGNLSEDLNLDPAEDPDTSFRFMQETNSSLIGMGRRDGLLTVARRIDRETLCGRATRCLVAFDVVVFSKDKFHLVHVEVSVRDVNDHAPEFPRNVTRLDVPEDVAVGTRFPLDAALDPDVEDNHVQTYRVSRNSHFGIEVRSRADGSRFAELVLVRRLDREAQDEYALRVTASDGGTPPRSGSLAVHVAVVDVNDNSPVFEHDVLRVEVHEDAPVGFLLVTVRASDPDRGDNGQVRYDFAAECGQEVRDTFHVDPDTGAITLKSLVDFESRTSYELDVQAYDLGPNSVPSTCKVVVDVVDVNDNAPEISIKPMTWTSDGTARITETAAVESFVALISTSDRDSGANGYVRVSLSGHDHFRLQQAYGDAFMVVTAAALDREKVAEYHLTVVAEDLGSPPFRTARQYTIRVGDDNDNPPLFSKPAYDVSVMENKPPGSYIATVVARDPDEGVNGQVTYELVDADVAGAPLSSLVTVDATSGSLYAVGTFNYEAVKQIDVTIRAADGGTPQRSSVAVVRVKVVDQNDNAPFMVHPVLANGSADVPVPLGAPAGYLALALRARDADEGVNAELNFRILADRREAFTINRVTGEMALKSALSGDYGDIIYVRVAVTDNGRSPLSCEATLRFVITDMGLSGEPLAVAPESEGVAAEESDVDTSLVVIALLGAGCGLLLVAIVGVASSHRRCRGEQPVAGGLVKKSPLSNRSVSSAESDSDTSEQHSTVTEQLSDGSTDQTSVKDSGKGDSDFNDSDSDVSGGAGQKVTEHSQLRTQSKFPVAILFTGHTCKFDSTLINMSLISDVFYPGPMDRRGQIYKMAAHASSSRAPSSSYSITFSKSPACGQMQNNPPRPSWRNFSYSTMAPKAVDPHRHHLPHRSGTLRPSFYKTITIYNKPSTPTIA
uniref:Cadherin domain-containing protein n=1 Tax=Denticeps clupeoides TaxID=299321 RepID=A0AAY4ASE9_9TELE